MIGYKIYLEVKNPALKWGLIYLTDVGFMILGVYLIGLI